MTSLPEPAPRASVGGRLTLALAITLASLAVISTRAGVFDRPLCPHDPELHPWQVLGSRKFYVRDFHHRQPVGCPPHRSSAEPTRR